MDMKIDYNKFKIVNSDNSEVDKCKLIQLETFLDLLNESIDQTEESSLKFEQFIDCIIDKVNSDFILEVKSKFTDKFEYELSVKA